MKTIYNKKVINMNSKIMMGYNKNIFKVNC